MQWQVDGEGQTAPPTADLRLATKRVQSAMQTTQPAPLSPGCDPVQGESSSDEHKSANKESIVFISSGCSDAFAMCCPAEHQLQGRDLFSVA